MKFNKLLIAATTLVFAASSQAWQIPSQPQSLQNQSIKEHGIPHQTHGDENTPLAVKTKVNSSATQQVSMQTTAIQAAAVCNVNAFATTNSTTLINEIKTQGSTCVNELFGASSSTQMYAFDSNNMYSVANHTASLANSYVGLGDPDLEALYLYLRAGYYAEFYNNSITFVSWVHPAAKGAIDAFVNNAHFYDNNDNHGKVLQEVIIAMDSTENQDKYMHVVREWLGRWDQNYATSWNMRSAVNGVFTILFRGQWNADFKTAMASDTALVNNLRSFTMASWMINSDAEYMIANAGRELGRLKLYTGGSIQSSVDAGLNNIFSTYQMYGNGDAVWLGAADTADYHGNCADYGICGFGAKIEEQALSQIHVCSPTIQIRSQNLTPVQQASACATMGAEETYFHSKLQTGNNPIPGDTNTQLQVNIFDKDTDYQKYAAAIFGINTNNGGMYLEGDPSVANNIPNFVAYEASYAKPDHYVWNLEHEYVHYLDGRFDLAGDFNAPTAKVVWWAEGVAEYVANQDNNQNAYDTIHDGSTYGLSTIFATTYDGFDVDRIYRWGYLAVRFMFERHINEVTAMRNETRAGNWTAYQTRVNSWANNYSNEFTTWLQTVTPGTTTPNNQRPVASANGPYAADKGVNISFISRDSYDPDGSIASYSWDFGDGGSSAQANPTYSYTTAGNYTATLTVTDDKGATGSASASVTINDSGIPPTGQEIQNGGSKTRLAANTGDTTETFFINVPSGATNLVINISGSGRGDADLFVKQGSAPTTNSHDCRPYIGGNNETCTIASPTTGKWYMNINAYSTFSDVTLTASFDSGQTTPNESPVPYINGPYSGDEGVAVSFSSAGSYDPNGSIASYLWNFGDGTSSSSANPSHTYNTAKSYTVTLSVTDNEGLTETATTTADIAGGNTNPGGNVPDMCAVQGPQTSGEVEDGVAICLGSTTTSWYNIGDVDGYSSMAITISNGTGDLSVDFSNTGWPDGSNNHGSSNNPGNSECIYLTNLTEYWGYLKVSGASDGASLVVDFDTQGCR